MIPAVPFSSGDSGVPGGADGELDGGEGVAGVVEVEIRALGLAQDGVVWDSSNFEFTGGGVSGIFPGG